MYSVLIHQYTDIHANSGYPSSMASVTYQKCNKWYGRGQVVTLYKNEQPRSSKDSLFCFFLEGK